MPDVALNLRRGVLQDIQKLDFFARAGGAICTVQAFSIQLCGILFWAALPVLLLWRQQHKDSDDVLGV
jgi:hypothetical protein